VEEGGEGMKVTDMMPAPPADFEVVIVVFKRVNGERKTSMAQKSLYFPDTGALLDWSDNSGVDFS
jgi:hypothetical protein